MNTSSSFLPAALKEFVDEQVAEHGFGTRSEYLRELIRKEQERQGLRGMLLAGAASDPAGPTDAVYFAGLRRRARSSGVRGRSHSVRAKHGP